ncbi:MAG: ABC transporter permease [Acidimicrobiia bacterium]|nr:ABC transporter permease [Acidimicrobiia bacterium]
MVITALRLAAADFRARASLLVAAILLVATPLAGYLLLDGFARGIDRDFTVTASVDLIVQEANSVGEITGSRIPAGLEADLVSRGLAFAIPEIHSLAGSSAENAVLVRGIDLDRYRSITRFDIVSGRPLQPGDPPDHVMLGADLAERRTAGIGTTVTLRGRPFGVVGVYTVGTYADNEVWLSLAGARDLLGWGDEVSMFVVPGNGPLAEGDVLPGPLSVARRGDFVALVDEWDPIFALANVANLALAAAAAIVLAVILWRLAWLRRRELAILRAIGMSRRVTVAYLLVEGTTVAVAGLVAGIAAAVAMGTVVEIRAFGLAARAVFDGSGIVRATALTAVILGCSVAAAAVRAVRTRPAESLRGA